MYLHAYSFIVLDIYVFATTENIRQKRVDVLCLSDNILELFINSYFIHEVLLLLEIFSQAIKLRMIPFRFIF
jgi:hypothetical protein